MAEQEHYIIEFCIWLGKSGSEILQLIHLACGDNAMRQAAVLKWWKHFRDGETDVKDEHCSSRPNTVPVPLSS
jgi:hypothetical protein